MDKEKDVNEIEEVVDIEKPVGTIDDVYSEALASLNEPVQDEAVIESGVEDEPAEVEEDLPVEPETLEHLSAPAAGDPEGVPNADMTAQMQEIYAENIRLKEMLTNREKTLEQQSELAERSIQEELLEPPVFDFNGYEYLDEDERVKAQGEYSRQMSEFATKSAMQNIKRELSPMIEQLNRAKEMEETNTVKANLSKNPSYEGFADNEKAIESIIANEPALQGLDPNKRYTIAYLMVKGLTKQPEQKKTDDDIVNEVMSNPEILRKIETIKAQKISKTNASVPKFSATQGAVPASPTQTPKTLDEANRNALKYFGL